MPENKVAIPDDGERIAKVMARAGLCSRREAERWVEEGRVSINGITLKSPAVLVGEGDSVVVDGKALPARDIPRVWRFHKPIGVLVSERPPDDRPTIYDVLPKDLPRVIPVGRLDINSEGLLLLTNDGELKRKLELPDSALRRRYRVRVHGRVSEPALASLKKGITVEGVRYGSIDASVEKQNGANAWLIFTLTEGKNREIRKVCAHLGLQVNRLIRQAYGDFSLGALPKGGLSEIPQQQLRSSVGTGMKPKDSWAKPKRKFIKPKQKPKPGTVRGGRMLTENAAESVKTAPMDSQADRFAGKPTDRPASRSMGKPAGKPTDRPVGKPMGKPAGKPTDRPVGKSMGKPAGKPADRPVGKPMGKSAGKPTDRPASRSMGKPAGKSTDRPVGKSMGKPAGKPTDRPAGKPASKSTGSPTGKPADKRNSDENRRRPASRSRAKGA